MDIGRRLSRPAVASAPVGVYYSVCSTQSYRISTVAAAESRDPNKLWQWLCHDDTVIIIIIIIVIDIIQNTPEVHLILINHERPHQQCW